MNAAAIRLHPHSDWREEAARDAVALLRDRLANGESHENLLASFLEDDLQECGRALDEVSGWYDEVLRLLADPATRTLAIVDQADDGAVLEELEALLVAVSNLRRRMLKVAARLPR
ncbi:MAG: hypothetical protein ACK4N5_03400 [Myxococcales bacterium]